MIPPILVFFSYLFIYGFGKTALGTIFIPLVWLCIYKKFLTDMKEDNINQDVFSKFTYIFLIEIFTYGLPLIFFAKHILESGWF